MTWYLGKKNQTKNPDQPTGVLEMEMSCQATEKVSGSSLRKLHY